MKKIMCLFVCGLLTVGALTGCGSSADTTTDSGNTTTDAAAMQQEILIRHPISRLYQEKMDPEPEAHLLNCLVWKKKTQTAIK